MNDFNKDRIDEYTEMNRDYLSAKNSLENLMRIKSSINEERFNIQKEEYDKKIEHLSPKLNKLKEKLDGDLNKLTDEFKIVENEFNKLNKAIDEEKKLYKGKVIPKEQYILSIEQLIDELKSVKPTYNDFKLRIKSIENALSNKESFSVKMPGFGMPNIKGSKSPRDMKKDFWKGFFVIVIIAIALPLLGFFILSLKGIALFIIPIIALIVGIAFLGRIVGFLQQIWK